MKTDKSKQLLIEQLRKTPIVLVACEKMGISRATFYRWFKEDEKFKEFDLVANCPNSCLVPDLQEPYPNVKLGNRHWFWIDERFPFYGSPAVFRFRVP